MDNNSFWINLIAKLKKDQSKKQIKTDVKSLEDIFINLIGKLDLVKTRKNIKSQLKDLNNNTFTITPTVNSKNVQNATKQAVNNAQKTANNNKVKIDFEVNKQKLINQIKILGRDNSKLFNNSEISAKYNQLLDSAKIANSNSELKSLRGQLSAFRTELKATNNAGMTWIDKFKSSISSFAQYFSGASFIYAMTNQLKNAWKEAKTLDDSLVDLQKVTDEIGDRDTLYKYFDRAMSKAQELNVKVDSLLYSITEFKKLGWSLSDAELGGQWATILENVGDVNIDTAIGSIKTAIASFDEIGGFGNDQIDKKIEAYVDLINNMSNKFSIDAEGLSEAIRLSAGTLREAHTSIEQAATIFSTANRYYNDPDYLGNTLKIGSLRMRASSGDNSAVTELEEMGEQIDDLAEATSNLRGQLLALTGVDIMIDEHTFKSYYDQLYEISQVIDDLNDTSRANVLETLFGKNRSAAGAAILSGMKESADAYTDAINSAGSATEEYNTWMQSADAATQRFANNLTQTYQSIVNGNTVRDLSNLGSAVLEFANDWGIVEGTIKGVIVLGLGKFLTTSTMAMITATKSVEQYGKALQLANNVPDGNLATRYKTLRDIAQATSLLTDAQKKQVLSSQLLSEQDRIRILSMQNMTKEMAVQKVAEMGLTQATNSQTAANAASTASTFSLKSAMVGLGATIKSVFLSNPIGIAIMAISTAIGVATSAISKHNQKLEEMREKAKEAADKANTLGDEIAELASKYLALSEAVKTDKSAKDDLLTTQTELLKKLNLEGKSVDELIAKYGSLSDAIRQVSIDSLKDAQIDLIAGVDAARKELLDAGANGFWSGDNIINAAGDDAVKAFHELQKAGIVDSDSFGTGGGTLVLIGDDKTVEGILENYKRLEDALNALRDSNAFTAEELSNNSLYQAIYGRYSEMKDKVEDYNSAIVDLNENLSQQTMLAALQGREIPKTVEDFETLKQNIIDTAIASKQFIGNEQEIANAVNSYLATVAEFSGFYSDPLEKQLERENWVKEKDITLTISQLIDQLNTQLKPAFDSLKSAYQNIFTDDGFNLNAVDIPMLEKIKSDIEELNNLENVDIDINMDDFDTFAKILTDVNTTEEQAQQAFDDLATSIFYATGATEGMTDETVQLVEQLLESLGIVNAHDVATTILAEKNLELVASKRYLAETTAELADATGSEIAQFGAELVAANECGEALALFYLKKAILNMTTISTEADINNILSLAEAAGVSTKALAELASVKAQFDTAVASGDAAAMDKAQARLNSVYEKVRNDVSNFKATEIKLDFKAPDVNSASKAGSSAGKAAGEAFTDAFLDKELEALDKKMEAGYIDFNDYIQARLDLIEDYYRQGKISADEYYSYLNKHYDKQLSYMDKVVSAVVRRVDSEIKDLQKNKDSIKEYYDLQIEALQKEKSLLSEANEQRQKQKQLQESLYNLERARQQRTTLQYTEGKGVHYVASDSAIRTAQDEVADAQYQIQISEIEKSISLLEEARDKEIDAIDEMISKLQDYKNSWQDITSAYVEQQEDLIAAQVLGQEWEADILSGRLDTLNSFKDQYIAIQQAIVDAAYQAAQAIANAQNAASTFNAQTSNTVPVGAQYASGTNNAKKGLNLVGEDGAEAVFDNHDNVAIVTKPTLIPMEGGEVVKDAQDTKKLLNPDNIKPVDNIGLADIDGKEAEYTIKVNVETNGEIPEVLDNGVKVYKDGTIVRPNGMVLTPLPATDPFRQMCNEFQAYMRGTSTTVPNTAVEKNMEQMAKAIETINNNVNNSKIQQTVNQEFHITMPNVTDSTAATELMRDLQSISRKKFQVFDSRS